MTGFRWQFRVARKLALAVAALVLSQTAAGADPDLRIAGIGLSTNLTVFIEQYPEARVERFEATRYCHGEAVAIAPLLRVAADVTVGNRRLEVEFPGLTRRLDHLIAGTCAECHRLFHENVKPISNNVDRNRRM